MLLRCEVSNHRSIDEPIELTMIAIDRDRQSVRSFERLSEDVLTVAGIYGPNASGKSNVIDAITWLSEAVRHSLRSWDEHIPRDPFRFRDSTVESSVFEVSLEIDGVRYDYILDVNDSEVVFEALYSYPERRRRMLFEREGELTQYRRGLTGLSGVRDLLTPTTLFLSAASRFAPNELSVVAREISYIRTLGLQRRRRTRPLGGGGVYIPGGSTTRLFDDGIDRNQGTLFEKAETHEGFDERAAALSLLRFADLGIDDVEIVQEEGRNARRPQFVHRVGGHAQRFELIDESAGTRTWFELIGPVLGALRTGRVLLFDEIDASLHPRLSARLLDLFHDPETNPYGAQLIFTTHDTSLLNSLNRDEVWLTEKHDGATVLTALSDYGGDKVRKSLNLERAYLQGRFGAVPELDQTVVREALGLSAAPR
jgi:AAA15 family ATPase/GTPase